MNTEIKKYSYFILIITYCLTLLTACNHKDTSQTAQPPDIKVSVAEVQLTSAGNTLRLTGSILPSHMANLGFMVAGKVSKVMVKEGDRVKKGQTIATLDPTDYQSGKKVAAADLQEAEDQYKRLKQVYEQGSITEADWVKMQSAYEKAKAAYNVASKKVSDTRITSPINGYVAMKKVEGNEVVGQGTPLFSIVRTDPVKVKINIPETEISQVKVGQKVRVTLPSNDQIPATEGKISLLGKVATPPARTYNAEIEVANPDQQLQPGMIAVVDLFLESSSQRVSIPAQAVIRDAYGSSYVYVLDEKKMNVHKRIIEIGGVSGESLQILKGVKPGEKIITEGQSKLEEGTSVSLSKHTPKKG
ncbi:efflux RND transporter periplasmic adaptor subunit [Limibacter armeniacum]|uniref:efflux RND transporter periplasmic adaptor subunit n=1 Tax=Limibacter armeniacum TaxID=466084 RepID=UPI002FE5A6E8